MDRAFKAKDRVKVFKDLAEAAHGKPIAVFNQAPYTYGGFDNYIYEGVMYKGYRDKQGDESRAYIILTEPLHKEK